MGYHRAGFDVVGVDLFDKHTQSRYPFESHKADAIDFLNHDFLTLYGREFDVIHASPPCQHASAGTRSQDRTRYPRLIEATRDALAATSTPYVIENVRGADLITPLELCGCMFGLAAVDDDGERVFLRRPRLFESNVWLRAPQPHNHPRGQQIAGSYGGARRDKHEARHVRHGGYVPSKRVQEGLLGIDWMTEKGLHQAIPPAYTEWIGSQLIDQLGSGSVAPDVETPPPEGWRSQTEGKGLRMNEHSR